MRYTQNQPTPAPAPGCQLPVDRISPRPSLHFVHDGGSLQALAESIRQRGLMRPVLVRRTGNGRYAIVSGNRRLMACRMLGAEYISAYVLADDARRQNADQLVDALITRRLHYLEEAEALRVLNEQHGVSRGDLAAMLGRHPQAVAEQMRLASFDDELAAFLMDEGVPMSIALTLLQLAGQQRINAARRIARERLCVRDAALLVSAMHAHTEKNKEGIKREYLREIPIHTRKVIGVVRDRRPYINAIREIAGQMQSAGLRAEMSERQEAGRYEITLSIPTRRRRTERYQSM